MVVSVLGIGVIAALAMAWNGARTPVPDLEAFGGFSVDGRWSSPAASAGVGEDRVLECVGVFPPDGNVYLVAGENEGGLPLIATGHLSDTWPRRYLTSVLYNAVAETLAAFPEHCFTCPTGVGWPEPELLLWRPKTWHVPASPLRRDDKAALFRENYARESKILHRDYFMRSLRAAWRGDSLAVDSPLTAVRPDGTERFRVQVDPLYTADSGVVVRSGDSYTAYLETDGGFYNSDRFYVLFDQPALIEGKAQQFLGADDIEGGHRGLLAVDVLEGSMKWTLRTASSPVRTMAGDLNGDGLEELVVQLYCAENGVSGSGMTDAGTCYLLCLDTAGNLLWKKRFLGVHVGVLAAIADVTGDGASEVVVVACSARYMDMGYAAVLSGEGETLSERTDLGGLYGITVADFDEDGNDEIVTGGPAGTVLMLDGELELVAEWRDTVDQRRLPNWVSPRGTLPDLREADPQQCYKRVVPLASCDVDGDGRKEVLGLWTAWANMVWASSQRGSYFAPRGDLVVLSDALEEELRASVEVGDFGTDWPPSEAPASLKTHILTADMDGDGVREVLLSHGMFGFYVYRMRAAGTGDAAGADAGRSS